MIKKGSHFSRKRIGDSLSEAFDGLRNATSHEVLEFWDTYIDGLLQGLEAAGVLAGGEAETLIDLRNVLYDRKTKTFAEVAHQGKGNKEVCEFIISHM